MPISLLSRSALGVAILSAVLSFCPTAEAGLTLFASDAGTQQLYTLNPANASPTLVGSYGVSGIMGGLAYDSTNDILYGSEVTLGNLYRINRTTGAATLVGPLGQPAFQSLAFDSTNGRLYGAYGNTTNPSFYQINTTNGTATAIGTFNRTVSGLAFDPLTHVLYGSSTGSTPGVFTIDPLTGQILTTVSNTGFNGISFDPTTDKLYGVSNGGNVVFGGLAQGLYTIALPTGAVSLVGSLSLSNPLDIQFALTPNAVPEPGSLALTGLGLTVLAGSILRRQTVRIARS